MYVNDEGGLYVCRCRPQVHSESSAQEERNPSTQLPITQPNHQLSATHRSAHQDVQGADGGISLTLQQVLGFVKVSFSLYFT